MLTFGSGWMNLALPAATIAIAKCAMIIRVTRAATREALPMDYIRVRARAKGPVGKARAGRASVEEHRSVVTVRA